MGLNARVIKLGRLFMVAWLAFYLYPIGVILSGPFSPDGKALALGLLIASGAVWIWFWTRILAGPDQRFRVVAVALNALFIGSFTLMTPAKYGTVVVCVAVMAGAAFRWRVAVPLIAVVALTGGILDVLRGVSPLQASGEVLNDAIVGLAAVAGHLLLQANRQLSLAREQIARLAVGEERLRFARDLHDLLGHSLSVIALKSELAGRLIKNTPGLAAHEVEDIEKVAREALREVREAVAGYRQPTLAAELAGAHEALTAAGIQYHVDQDHAPLPPAVEAVLAWTVREGVTNVMRHSQATRCSIRITNQDGRATVEVVDDGRGGTLQPGSGLRGLRERVLERGGTLTAEPLPHEGFRLRVSLPLPEVAIPVDRVTA
ncbi:MAG TPA: sensor histidine kinase [Candidatus Dormibacteraeota bacterium]|nr:sensor histidine kinase [Candidatus Dormibacteraeota bacterium]